MRASLGFARNLQKPGAPIERSSTPSCSRHQGVVLATLMRFKDEWRANPKGESKRAPGEPVVLGSFRTPVDRSQPDTPITCGRDGCGGLIAGTPFERWRKTEQNCVHPAQGRPISGKDCGERSNQSLLAALARPDRRDGGPLAVQQGDLHRRPARLRRARRTPAPARSCPTLRSARRCAASRPATARTACSRPRTPCADDYTCPANAPPNAPCQAYASQVSRRVHRPGRAGRGPAGEHPGLPHDQPARRRPHLRRRGHARVPDRLSQPLGAALPRGRRARWRSRRRRHARLPGLQHLRCAERACQHAAWLPHRRPHGHAAVCPRGRLALARHLRKHAAHGRTSWAS